MSTRTVSRVGQSTAQLEHLRRLSAELPWSGRTDRTAAAETTAPEPELAA
ncbi:MULTISPECIES: hypothetical protein [Kitasatospora]|nr:hypothetical protein [Kitasatospora sp. GP30]MDH6145050.1 hypothetical protein [Kitasatospora sp. GP30]